MVRGCEVSHEKIKTTDDAWFRALPRSPRGPREGVPGVGLPDRDDSIAPTILSLLGLNPNALQAVQIEHTSPSTNYAPRRN
jgi:hypothetical protein